MPDPKAHDCESTLFVRARGSDSSPRTGRLEGSVGGSSAAACLQRLPTALAFSLILALILVASAALQEWLGNTGIVLAAGLADLVNTHSAAISVALLVGSGKIAATDAVLPILAGISTNSVVRIVLAHAGGGREFGIRAVPGLILVAVAA